MRAVTICRGGGVDKQRLARSGRRGDFGQGRVNREKAADPGRAIVFNQSRAAQPFKAGIADRGEHGHPIRRPAQQHEQQVAAA